MYARKQGIRRNARTTILAFLLGVVLSIAAICGPDAAVAASTVTISSSGDGVFLVQGVGIEGAAAMEINVGYDLSSLANPRVAPGDLIAGAMTAVNTNVPGAVRIVVIRLAPVNGSGVIATLTFDRKGASPGKITSLNVRLANSQGAPLPVLAQVSNPSETPAAPSAESETRESTPGTAQTAQATTPKAIIAGPSEKAAESRGASDVSGTGTPDERQVQPESGRESTQEPAVIARTSESASAASGAASRKIFAQMSILDRFRDYKGKRTPEAFIALFEQDSPSWCRQEPPVALADGRKAVRVTFISGPGERTSADVAVIGARLISMKKDPDNTNTWIVEVVPNRGEYRASIGVSQSGGTMVCPLTTAPNIASDPTRSKAMTKTEFLRYVNERGTASVKQYDVNKDGKLDYIDDYIMTANYLSGAGKDAVRGK